MDEKISVRAKRDGTCEVEAEGFVGDSCTAATKFLKGLGRKVGEKKKPDYFAEAEEQARLHEGQ